MKVLIGNNDIKNYVIVLPQSCGAAETYAASELIHYLREVTGSTLGMMTWGNYDYEIRFVQGDKNSLTVDGFHIYRTGNSLTFAYGGGRGAIYAVYAFLEKAVGVRFYAQGLAYRGWEKGTWMRAIEKIPTDGTTVIPDDFELKEKPAFYYRDGTTHALVHEEWCAKMRLNGETWDRKWMDPYLGGDGAVRFANKGGGGHTFLHLVSTKEYAQTHPEYFAEIDGKRVTTAKHIMFEPQLCLTNKELVPLIVEKLKTSLRENPDKKMVSVSPNDNGNYCQCKNCQASYEKYGKFGTLLKFVSEIAQELEKDYPETLVHTYMYTGCTDVNESVKGHKNVLVQYCPTKLCKCHALDDPTCPINRSVYEKIQTLGKVVEHVFIYDYRSCLKYSLFLYPDLFTLRETMRAYAENKVKGIYSELCIHAAQQPTFEELRAYLYAKLCWNPYMSQEEYEYHMDDFLESFYGKNWRYIKEFLIKWCQFGKTHHFPAFSSPMVDENLKYVRDESGNVKFCDIIPKDEIRSFCKWANEQFDKALEGVKWTQKMHLEIARTCVIWYELFHTMDDILENGTEEEKTAVIAKNRDLCSRMRRYCMKYTTYIGMTNQQRMYDDFSLSPSKWNYVGNIAGEEEFSI